MSCYSWNCRGLGNPQTVKVLTRDIKLKDPNIVFLMETKLLGTEIGKVCDKLGFPNFFAVDCDMSNGGRRGGLCILWKESTHLTVQYHSLHAIDVMIDGCWRLTGIYGWPEEHLKPNTWHLLKSLSVNNNSPWLCIGDFNEVLYHSEKLGGRPKDDAKIKAFRDTLSECNLDDISFDGFKFTWTNGQEGEHNIHERLDRCVANISWVGKFPMYKIEHMVRVSSDHCPILLTWTNSKPCGRAKRKRIFRFEKMWLQDASCTPFVQQAWSSHLDKGSPTHIKEKIHQLGVSLLRWESSHFGMIRKQLECARNQLEKLQSLPPIINNISATQALEKKILTLMKREETMWFQRARANWIKDGDKNTAFFHKMACVRQKRNSIDKILNANGQWVEEHSEIANVLLHYYENLFASTTESNFARVLDAINPGIPDELGTDIGVPFTESEIVAALSQMHPSKAPVPDGMPALLVIY